MNIRARAVVIAVACGLGACQAAGQDPPASREPAPEATASVGELAAPAAEDAPLYIHRAMLPPTPEMLNAALSNDPDAMRDAIVTTATSCQAASSCPAQFASCTNWSTPSLCSETCGGVCLCHPILQCGDDPPEPRGTDTFNSFRVCFDPNQNACTEWSNTKSTFCGCGT